MARGLSRETKRILKAVAAAERENVQEVNSVVDAAYKDAWKEGISAVLNYLGISRSDFEVSDYIREQIQILDSKELSFKEKRRFTLIKDETA